jgi:hypothetical protein
MGKKKPTRPARYLQLVPTPPELEKLYNFKLDPQTTDELKALIRKIANYGKHTSDEDPELPPAA